MFSEAFPGTSWLANEKKKKGWCALVGRCLCREVCLAPMKMLPPLSAGSLLFCLAVWCKHPQLLLSISPCCRPSALPERPRGAAARPPTVSPAVALPQVRLRNTAPGQPGGPRMQAHEQAPAPVQAATAQCSGCALQCTVQSATSAVQPLRQGLRAQGPPGRPRVRASLRVPPVPQGIRPEDLAGQPPARPHGGEALMLPLLLRGLPVQREAEGPRAEGARPLRVGQLGGLVECVRECSLLQYRSGAGSSLRNFKGRILQHAKRCGTRRG